MKDVEKELKVWEENCTPEKYSYLYNPNFCQWQIERLKKMLEAQKKKPTLTYG